MRILLLTYSFNYNYGGLLQAYATSKTLEKLGHTVSVPVSHPNYLVGNTSLFRGLGLRRQNPITAVLRRLRQSKRYQRFDHFRRRLPLDQSIKTKADIQSNVSRFDVVLTGSDQTWNTKFMPEYDSYFYQGFLPGGIVRKVSYASCFGTKEQREEALSCAAADLARFDSIAIRNEVSRNIVHRITGIDAAVVVDPTLLHDFAEFEPEPSKSSEGSPVVVYALDPVNFSTAEGIIRELLKRHPDMEVHFINGEKNFDKPSWATHLINSYGPLEFLKAIQSASFVVTDSFHGIIFAQKFGTACIGYTSGWRSERIIGLMEDFSAADLLLVDDNTDHLQRVVTKVADEGARLRMSDQLLRKIDFSKNYLVEALSKA